MPLGQPLWHIIPLNQPLTCLARLLKACVVPCATPCLVSLLNRLNSFLDHVDVGEYIVEGDLEAYSCEKQQ